jgi:NifU-like protein
MVVSYQIAEKLVCHCFGVTETEVRGVIQHKDAQTVEDVIQQNCAGNGCTACHFRIRRLLSESRRSEQCVGS